MRKLRTRKGLIVAVVATVCCLASAHTTSATFNAQTRNPGNTLSSGTVIITDNDSASNIFTLTNLEPNQSGSGCIKISYTGSVASTVRLYGTSSGTLASGARLVVTRGTIASGTFPSCTNFVPDTTVHKTSEPPGLIYSGPLSSFPSTWAAGVVDPNASWTNPTDVAYEFEVTINDDVTTANKSLSIAATWEAQQA